MNLMIQPNQICLIVKLYNNRPELLPDSNVRTIGIVIFSSYLAQGYKTFVIWMIFFYRLLLYGDINQGIIPKESLQTNYMYSICFIF